MIVPLSRKSCGRFWFCRGIWKWVSPATGVLNAKNVIHFASPAWPRIGLGPVELSESTRRHASPFVESFGHVLGMLESGAFSDGIQSQIGLG